MSVRSSVIAGVLVILSLNAAISSQEHPRERRQVVFPDDDDSGDQNAFSTSNKDEEDSPRCRGPAGDLGNCVLYNRCSALFGTEVDFNVLRQYRCGFSGVVPMVCCPESKNKPHSPIPDRTRRPTPTPTRRQIPTRRTTPGPGKRPPQLSTECGRSKVTGDRIFGGNESSIGAWPWLAALYFEYGGEKYLECGGALISNRHVVTASHCLHDANKGTTTSAEEISVRLGDHDLNSLDDKTEPVEIDVSRIIRHPKYNARTFHNDIAILVLKDEVHFNKFVQPICLAYDPPMLTQNYEGRVAYVAGWGLSSLDNPASSKLRDVSIPIWNQAKCREAYTRYGSLNEDYMCAGLAEGGKDSCKGDSGGPLMLSGGLQSRFHLVGVVSFGKGCALPNFPGVYTNVRRYLDWITASIS